jgi:hypothetical protein
MLLTSENMHLTVIFISLQKDLAFQFSIFIGPIIGFPSGTYCYKPPHTIPYPTAVILDL